MIANNRDQSVAYISDPLIKMHINRYEKNFQNLIKKCCLIILKTK